MRNLKNRSHLLAGSVPTNLRERAEDVVAAYLYGWTLACLLLGALLGAGLVAAVRR